MSLYLGEDKVTPIIKSGVTPTGTINITNNGTYNVANYASANVNFGGAGTWGTFAAKATIQNGVLTDRGNIQFFSLNREITEISFNLGEFLSVYSDIVSADFFPLITISGDDAFSMTFYGWQSLESVDFSNLTTISGSSAFAGAFIRSPLTSISFPSLATVNGNNAFQGAFESSSLTSVSFPSLATVSGENAFRGAFVETPLTSVSFPSLATVSGENAFVSAFEGCSSLTSVFFPALTTNSFGSYTNQFEYMLSGVSGCTVHFPSNLQSVIGSWSDVLAGFDGTNTTILFDLPATT